jgi:hypothetical protein
MALIGGQWAPVLLAQSEEVDRDLLIDRGRRLEPSEIMLHPQASPRKNPGVIVSRLD